MARHSRTLIVCAALALLATTALAQQRGRGPGHGPWHGHRGDGAPFARMLDRLELTDGQREQIEQRLGERQQANRALREQVRERRLALADAIHAEEFDEPAIRDAAARLAELEAGLAVERALGLKELLDALTPQQRDEARAMIQRHRQFMESGEGPRWFHGPGPRGGGPRKLDE